VKIITGRQAEKSAFVMPTDDELAKLHATVARRYPQLASSAPGFKAAFTAIGFLGRYDRPETKHYPAWWIDHLESWCRAEDIPGDISLAAFVGAVLSHGDIPYAPLDRFPFDLSFGLAIGGAGRRATDAWRKVLVTGQLLPPTAPLRSVSENYPVPPVEVRAG
jgi:hypothetical protein